MNLQQTLKELKTLLDRQDVIDFIAAEHACVQSTNTWQASICKPLPNDFPQIFQSWLWIAKDSDNRWFLHNSRPKWDSTKGKWISYPTDHPPKELVTNISTTMEHLLGTHIAREMKCIESFYQT